MKTILALAWSPEETAVFDTAGRLAAALEAHVVGLAPPSYRAVSIAWADVGMGGPFDMPAGEDEEERNRLAALRSAFLERMKAAGVVNEGAAAALPSAAWQDQTEPAPFAVGMAGRVHSLIVVPQPGPPPRMPESLFEGALFESGRPVLLVPAATTGPVGERIAIAWNASTESARCVAFAMPLLRRAKAIEVISVEGAMVQGPSGEELAVALRREGLPVTARHVPAGSKPAGQTLAEAGQKWGADMMVKGAYTQSRLRQMIFGGVTRHLILASPIPVFFCA